jgi:hypothetical protein
MGKETDDQTFAQVVDELNYGESFLSEEDEPEANPAEPADEDPDKESTPSPDNSDEEPKDEPEEKPATDAEPEPEEGEAERTEGEDADGEDKPDAPEGEDDSATVVELDGEQVTLEEIREWKQGNLRQDDYTRKSQANADERKRLEERDGLVAEIISDGAMAEFVKARPEVLPHLLKDADNTRAILGNAEEIQKLWDDYELVADNPRLAERFSGPTAGDAEAELAAQRAAENVGAVADALDRAVDIIAENYDGVDADAVRDYVLDLGGVPRVENPDPEEVVTAFGRLYSLMFAEENGKLYVKPELIQGHFELLKGKQDRSAAQSEADADEHNATVDAQLNDDSPPATPKGDGPAPIDETVGDEDTDVRDVIRRLYGHE